MSLRWRSGLVCMLFPPRGVAVPPRVAQERYPHRCWGSLCGSPGICCYSQNRWDRKRGVFCAEIRDPPIRNVKKQKNTLNRVVIFIYYTPWGITLGMEMLQLKILSRIRTVNGNTSKTAAVTSISIFIRLQLCAQIPPLEIVALLCNLLLTL
jgi:hypothetical protein